MPRDWKAMVKKGVELAKEARSELEERGLLGGDQSQPAGTPPAPFGAGDPAAEVYRVTGPDHPHPFELLTTADVAAALGVGPESVTGPAANVVDDCAGPSWKVRTAGGEVTVDLLLYLYPVDVDELLGYTEEGVRRLAGVGDRTAVAEEGVAVTRGGEVVTVHAFGGGGFDRRAALEAMAAAVAARLPDFRQYAVRMSAPGGPVLTDVFPADRLGSLLGVALELPDLEQGDDEFRAVWREEVPAGLDREPLRVTITVYQVDPEEKQRRAAAGGGVVAQAALQFGQAMKEQLGEHFRPVPGPWDEGYLWPTRAYFKKGGRAFDIEIRGADRDFGAPVKALAERLASKV